MSTYSTPPMHPQQNHTDPPSFVSQYPQLPQSPQNAPNAPQAYMNVDPQLNHTEQLVQTQRQPDIHPQTQTQTQTQTQANSRGKKSEGTRLRKACDSCSVRKVKCDVAGPPCKACMGLGIPCTYARESKRRGPPNRHAENLKKRRFNSDGGSGMSQPTSPTQTAQTLAAFAQQAVLSAESICPLPILRSLVDDYFTYVHPLHPLPHRPTFVGALDRREDVNNPFFLALLASMVGCLVSSFPRRPQQQSRHHNILLPFQDSRSFVSRCQQVILQARGVVCQKPESELDVHDAIISYLQGITAANTYDRQSMITHFQHCQWTLNTIGAHKTSHARVRPMGVPQARMVPNGHILEGPQAGEEVDHIEQELRRRTFWALFVGIRSLQQIGVSRYELIIPPATEEEPYPPLPLEVDDEFLTPPQVFPQPLDVISELTGFNANVRVFTTYNDLAAIELVYGPKKVIAWDKQKRVLEDSLRAIKRVCEGLPTELSFNTQAAQAQSNGQQYPPPIPSMSGAQEMSHFASNDFGNRAFDYSRVNEGRRIQHDIQKANIHASQLSTRLFLLEKYWTLSNAHDRHQPNSNNANSPLLDTVLSNLDKYNPSSQPIDPIEQHMNTQHQELIKPTLHFIVSFTQVITVPISTNLFAKVRQIASALLDTPPHRKQGSLDANAADFLRAFLAVLTQLEGHDGDDEAYTRHWAELRGCQLKFLQSGGLEPH